MKNIKEYFKNIITFKFTLFERSMLWGGKIWGGVKTFYVFVRKLAIELNYFANITLAIVTWYIYVDTVKPILEIEKLKKRGDELVSQNHDLDKQVEASKAEILKYKNKMKFYQNNINDLKLLQAQKDIEVLNIKHTSEELLKKRQVEINKSNEELKRSDERLEQSRLLYVSITNNNVKAFIYQCVGENYRLPSFNYDMSGDEIDKLVEKNALSLNLCIDSVRRFENIKILSISDQSTLQSKISEAENSVNLIIKSNIKKFKLQLANSLETVKSMKNPSDMNGNLPGDIYANYMGHIQSDVQISVEEIFKQ